MSKREALGKRPAFSTVLRPVDRKLKRPAPNGRRNYGNGAEVWGWDDESRGYSRTRGKAPENGLRGDFSTSRGTRTVGAEIRPRGLFWTVCGATLLVVGMLILGGLKWAAEWTLANLHRKADEYRAEIAALKETSAKLTAKTWKLELVDYDIGQRRIRLPKGMAVD